MTDDNTPDERTTAVLGKALRDAGRDDLAEALEDGAKPKPAEPTKPEETEGEQFIRELQQANEASWSSSPRGLLDD